MIRTLNISVLIGIGALASGARAEELDLANVSIERPHIVSVRTGLDHAFTAELGYTHVFALGDRTLLLGADVAMPWAKPDLGDYQVRLSAAMPVVEHGPWKLRAQLRPTLRGSDTPLARMTTVGASAGLSAGYHARRAFAAIEAEVDWAAASHIHNSMMYRDIIYPDATDGWYSSTGGTVRAGAYGGVALGNVELVLRVGRPMSIDLDAQTIPFYALLGVNVAR